eukprot:scaffold91812_cov17-Tisochrysis_lutea.AAC.1
MALHPVLHSLCFMTSQTCASWPVLHSLCFMTSQTCASWPRTPGCTRPALKWLPSEDGRLDPLRDPERDLEPTRGPRSAAGLSSGALAGVVDAPLASGWVASGMLGCW